MEDYEQLRRDTDFEIKELKTQHQLECDQFRQEQLKWEHDAEVLKLQHSHALDESAKFIERCARAPLSHATQADALLPLSDGCQNVLQSDSDSE